MVASFGLYDPQRSYPAGLHHRNCMSFSHMNEFSWLIQSDSPAPASCKKDHWLAFMQEVPAWRATGAR